MARAMTFLPLAVLLCLFCCSSVVLANSSCSVYNIPAEGPPSQALYRSVLVGTQQNLYNYSTLGAPAVGTVGQLVTGVEALGILSTAQVDAATKRGAFLQIVAAGNYPLSKWSDFAALVSNPANAPVPLSLPHWTDDAYFGFVRKTSAHQHIQRASTLPFALQDAQVQGLLKTGETLQSALDAGRLYVEDNSFYNNFQTFLVPGRYAPGVITLLYQAPRPNKALLPIAISVSGSVVWTPLDSAWDWQLAKLYANTASFLAEQNAHFVRQHVVPATIRVAATRFMYEGHPVRVFLDHYLANEWGVIAAGLQRVYQGDGGDYSWPISTTGLLTYLGFTLQSYDWRTESLEARIAVRGLGDLDNFRFKSDGLLHLKAINKFTSAYIDLYYSSDAAVAGDAELKATAGDLVGRINGFPTAITSKAELAAVLSQIVFGTVEHHSVNLYAVHNVYSPPFYNRYMTAPPPTTRGTVTEETILNYMPHSATALLGLFSTGAPYYKTISPEDNIINALGRLANEPCLHQAARKYKADLARIQTKIEKREATSTFKFPFLQPSLLPYTAFI
eukprot:jgi/Chlat1/4070/Chrsp26S04113